MKGMYRKKNIYEMIKEESSEYNEKQSEKMATQFLQQVKDVWKLSDDSIERIKLRSSIRTSEYCNHIHTSGKYIGIKCRNVLELSTHPRSSPLTKCKEHQINE